jgi:hypothetical protein
MRFNPISQIHLFARRASIAGPKLLVTSSSSSSLLEAFFQFERRGEKSCLPQKGIRIIILVPFI